MGVVKVSGQYEPGSVVELFLVKPDAMTAVGGELVDRKLVDPQGVVEFFNVAPHLRYRVFGRVNGVSKELSVTGVEPGESDPHTSQPSITPTPQAVGTQEAMVPDPPPALPEAFRASVPTGASAPIASPVSESEVTFEGVPFEQGVTVETEAPAPDQSAEASAADSAGENPEIPAAAESPEAASAVDPAPVPEQDTPQP